MFLENVFLVRIILFLKQTTTATTTKYFRRSHYSSKKLELLRKMLSSIIMEKFDYEKLAASPITQNFVNLLIQKGIELLSYDLL